jgi:hypothetical protein
MCSYATQKCQRFKEQVFYKCISYHQITVIELFYKWSSSCGVGCGNNLILIFYSTCIVQPASAYILYITCSWGTGLILSMYTIGYQLHMQGSKLIPFPCFHASLNGVLCVLVEHINWCVYSCMSACVNGSTNSFFNPILFAICTSTFSKLCVTYAVTCRRELSSAPL